MTAEIAILNKEAVALAADSAVSSSGRYLKIFNSANKIFGLSKYQPIGIMIYGSAGLLGVPWEIVIKAYRHKLRMKSFPQLSDYAEDFIRFINSSPLMFPDAAETSFNKLLLTKRFTDMFGYLRQSLLQRTERKGAQLDDSEVIEIVGAAIREEKEYWDKIPPMQHVTDEFKAENKSKYNEEIERQIHDIFQGLVSDPGVFALLRDLAHDMLVKVPREESRHAYTSGVVVAGFGTEQFFPAMKNFIFEGMINHTAKYYEDSDVNITHDQGSVIRPFAHREMVDTFMQGISIRVRDKVAAGIAAVCSKFGEKITEHCNSLGSLTQEEKLEFERKSTELKTGLFRAFNRMLNEYINQEYIAPVIDTVEMLPKDELASLAESLVYLTSLKQRVSSAPETVGGPIDVAIITKGDGLIWIKRKHYFKPELNPHFFKIKYMENLNGHEEN